MRLWAWLTMLFVLFALFATSTAFAQSKKPDLIVRGQELFEDQQYEESIQTLSAALLKPDNTREQKVEIYRLLALNYITLGRRDEADSAVRGLLVVEPDYQLPPHESPRFRDFFKETRAKWEAEGRPGVVVEKVPPKAVALKHTPPSSADKETSIDLSAKLDDPDHRAATVKLFWRTGSQGDFKEESAVVEGVTVKARIPASGVKPPLMDYYFEVADRTGTVLAGRGDAQAPLRIAIPDGSGNRWLVPLAVGGGILGAAALLGGLALAGVFSSSNKSAAPAATNATVRVNVGEAGFHW